MIAGHVRCSSTEAGWVRDGAAASLLGEEVFWEQRTNTHTTSLLHSRFTLPCPHRKVFRSLT